MIFLKELMPKNFSGGRFLPSTPLQMNWINSDSHVCSPRHARLIPSWQDISDYLEILLNLARSIFEEQNNLECLVTKIMREAQDLLKCERCAVYLLNLDCCEANHLERILERPGKVVERHGPLHRAESGTVTAEDMRENGLKKPSVFTTVFELRECGKQTLVSRPSSFDLASSTLAQIAGYASSTGQILNIGDVRAWLKEKHSEGDAESARTILCMPIINGQKNLIGTKPLAALETVQDEANATMVHVVVIYAS
ncbi:hypothetical protein JTB14_026649 [Gonioctena quinquepunctata]|nr:hypothetical protein JTB14_026649 [Gonioctena quinquepunctata]